ncbi:MAG: (d)CMP kinase, partial [Planctomycetota bacterium]
MIVTIDGPAGAGKSSVAQRLALRVGFQFLDTGAMYRAVTLAAKRAGHDWNNDEQLVKLTTAQTITFQDHRTLLNGQDVSAEIRVNEISQLVRYAANNLGVRNWLVERQRELGRDTNLVTEGRDQGTVVFPQAELKIFLTASPEERARRRWLDLRQRGEEVELAELLAQQHARDASDAAREVGPLKPAPDALHLLTDGLTLGEVELRLEQMVRRRQQEIVTLESLATGGDSVAAAQRVRKSATTAGGSARVNIDAQDARREFVWRLPKAELHVQLEKTMESELLLRTERDFCELAGRYFERVAGQGVRHVNLFFDAHRHAALGVSFATMFYGVTAAIDRAQRTWGITTALLPCLQIHLPVESVLQMMAAFRPYRAKLAGVGVDVRDGDELKSGFDELWAAAHQLRLNLVPHTTADGAASFVRQGLCSMHVAVVDPAVLADVGRFLVDHLWACEQQLGLTNLQLVELAKLSFAVSPLNESRQQQLWAEVDEYQR